MPIIFFKFIHEIETVVARKVDMVVSVYGEE